MFFFSRGNALRTLGGGRSLQRIVGAVATVATVTAAIVGLATLLPSSGIH